MKKFIFIFLALLISITGCSSQNDSGSQKNTVSNKISQYDYSDDFFNYNFSQDENSNYYFEAGMYFYQLDQQNNLKKLFHRLIDDKYWINDIKYHDGQFYCLVLKVNHDYGNAPLGLATIDINGHNFNYLNDLVSSNGALSANIVNMRIDKKNIYILDLYNEESTVYTYSLDSQEIIDTQHIDINDKRYEFYKKSYPEFPYDTIDHIYKNNFYTIVFKDNNEKVLIQYDPINKTSKQYDMSRYYDASDQKIGLFYIDLIDNHWFLFSSKGVFMFDSTFENEKQLLDESVFEQTYNRIYKDNSIILEPIN